MLQTFNRPQGHSWCYDGFCFTGSILQPQFFCIGFFSANSQPRLPYLSLPASRTSKFPTEEHMIIFFEILGKDGSLHPHSDLWPAQCNFLNPSNRNVQELQPVEGYHSKPCEKRLCGSWTLVREQFPLPCLSTQWPSLRRPHCCCSAGLFVSFYLQGCIHRVWKVYGSGRTAGGQGVKV